MYDRPFRWWVQSVMPLVFDDSLSYYEVLAKLTKYIEGLTGDVEQIENILATIEGIDDVTQFTEFLESIKAEIGNLNNLQTDTKVNLVSAINEIALKADNAYSKPSGGIPESDLSQEVKDKLNRTVDATEYIINNRKLKTAPNNNTPSDLGLGTYTVPEGGIPWDTLSDDVKSRINQGGGGGTGGTTDYTDLNNKPQINGHTLNAGNNTAESLGLGTYSKPSDGIPESDLSAEVQQKLNTSGGVADSEDSFVATRDYQAGELVYINGTLYKVKYNILRGTNLIPGNNIEVTDISAELEDIKGDIDALQSGSGPDSWNLSEEVSSTSSSNRVEFFKYFNVIGGETYNIICTPLTPSQNVGVAFSIEFHKRNGDLIYTKSVNMTEATNVYRFTFTPNVTGECYCVFARGSQSGTASASQRITIEYTESQGMTELWNQVNQATQLTPRVSALETLTGQQQIELDALDGIPGRVTTLEGTVASQQTQLDALDGIPDDVENLSDEVDELNSDFNSAIITLISNNLLNPANISVGKYYKTTVVDNRTMLALTENSAFSCGFIDIVPGHEYSLTGISYAAYNGDAEGYAIGVANASTTGVANPTLDTTNVRTNYHNTDKTITRLYFSWRPASYPTDTFMANEGQLLPYEPYGEIRSLAADIKVSPDNVTEEIYFVDVNGNGDFTSLMDAFVTLGVNENSKTIYVLSGEYDIYNEIGGDDFVNSIPSDAESYWDYITLVPKNTKVIGVGGVVLTYLPETVPEIAAQFISPINVSDGDVYIENIKIICKNCRYGIHDQTRINQPKGYNHIYKNVNVLKDDANGYTGKAQAYGGGMNKSANLVFEDCVFQSNRIAWSLHNAGDGSGDVVMRNCAFNNLIATRDAHPSVRFGNVSGTQTRVGVNMSGCYLNDGVRVTNESTVERPNAFDVTMINCIGNTTVTVVNETNIYTPLIFNAQE